MSHDIKERLKKLSLDDKLKLLTGKNVWETHEVDGIIKSLKFHDGPHGLRVVYDSFEDHQLSYEATCFPTASALASTFNKKLAYKTGQLLALESKRFNTDLLLAPGINIKKHPLCGRNFEYFSEDPYASGILGSYYINGVQSKNVGSCVKHYACNNQEHDRFFTSSDVDERTLHELYLKPFYLCVKNADPKAVMCAYNLVNGEFCSENSYLLKDILRDKWGYKGLVISDWGAVKNRAKSLKSGIDIEMPYNQNSFNNLKDALKNKLIDEDMIDKSIENILNFAKYRKENINEETNSFDMHEEARKVAEEAITLLKNEDNILPLKDKEGEKVLFVGGLAEKPLIQGGGSSKVKTNKIDSPLNECRNLVNNLEINYSMAYSMRYNIPTLFGYRYAIDMAKENDKVVIFVGNSELIEKEETDRQNINLDPAFIDLINKIYEVNKNIILVVMAGDVVDLSSINDKVKAIVYTWFAGEGSGHALAKILMGKVSPSGKTQVTFPLKLEDTPAYPYYPGDGYSVKYQEGLYVGYRHYDKYNVPVLYEFGFGLSYANFEYSNLSISRNKDSFLITCDITNTSNIAAKEAVQLYVGVRNSKVERPIKELKDFEKVSLEPNETKTVEFILNFEDLSYYDCQEHDFVIEKDCDYEIMVGSSSKQIHLSSIVKVL